MNRTVSGSVHRSACIALALATAQLGGCHLAVRDQAQVDPIVASNKPFNGGAPFGLGGQPEPIVPNCRVDQWVGRAAGSWDEIDCAASVGPEKLVRLPALRTADPVARRTEVQAELMTYADQVCDDHVAKIYANHASLNFDFGFLTTLLTGGAAIASGRAATNLAAGGALVSGTRSLVNSEVYYGYIGPAVMREIRSLRSDLRTQIAAKRSCGIVDYPPQEAIDDALTYHGACSFSTGLASLLSKAGKTTIGEDKLRTAQLAATATQLAEKKKELTAARERRAALDARAATERAKPIDQEITSLQHDIGSLEGILRFAGIVDPNGGAEVPGSLPIETAQAELAAATSAGRNAKSDAEKTAAAARIGAANDRLDTLREQRKSWHERDQKISQLQSEVARLSSAKVDVLEHDGDDRDAKAARLQQDIERILADIAATRASQETTPAPAVRAGVDIEFGIQTCKPIRIATVQ